MNVLSKIGGRTWTDVFSISLVLLGVIYPLGQSLNIPVLYKVARAVSVSPAPEVYASRPGYLNNEKGRAVHVGCEEHSGKIRWVPYDHVIVGRIEGPQRRIVRVYSPSVSRGNPTVARALFCKSDVLNQVAGCPRDFKSVWMKGESKSGREWTKETSCAD